MTAYTVKGDGVNGTAVNAWTDEDCKLILRLGTAKLTAGSWLMAGLHFSGSGLCHISQERI